MTNNTTQTYFSRGWTNVRTSFLQCKVAVLKPERAALLLTLRLCVSKAADQLGWELISGMGHVWARCPYDDACTAAFREQQQCFPHPSPLCFVVFVSFSLFSHHKHPTHSATPNTHGLSLFNYFRSWTVKCFTIRASFTLLHTSHTFGRKPRSRDTGLTINGDLIQDLGRLRWTTCSTCWATAVWQWMYHLIVNIMCLYQLLKSVISYFLSLYIGLNK